MIRPDDRVLPFTRVVAAVVVVILVFATWILYLHPGETEAHFAWTIASTMTALFMGAGYGSAVYFYVRMVAVRRWHRVAVGFIPTTIFTWLMLGATVLHWSKFHHGQFAFELWLWVYIVTPVLVPLVWVLNRRTDPGTLEARDARLPQWVRWALVVVGIGLCATSAWLYVLPSSAIAHWPWTLTPLTSRVVASFIAIPGVTWLMMAGDGRWSACRIPLETTSLSIVLMAIGVARAWSEFDHGNPITWLFVGGMVVTLLGIGGLAILMDRLSVAHVADESQPASA
jgi:hypothetical protein